MKRNGSILVLTVAVFAIIITYIKLIAHVSRKSQHLGPMGLKIFFMEYLPNGIPRGGSIPPGAAERKMLIKKKLDNLFKIS
jgi:hypothetical protein